MPLDADVGSIEPGQYVYLFIPEIGEPQPGGQNLGDMVYVRIGEDGNPDLDNVYTKTPGSYDESNPDHRNIIQSNFDSKVKK